MQVKSRDAGLAGRCGGRCAKEWSRARAPSIIRNDTAFPIEVCNHHAWLLIDSMADDHIVPPDTRNEADEGLRVDAADH